MLELDETKTFLRVDGNDEDCLISSLIVAAKELVEETLRRKIEEFDPLPETIRQAMLIVVATLYEQRQMSAKTEETLPIKPMLCLIRRMLFAYRKEQF